MLHTWCVGIIKVVLKWESWHRHIGSFVSLDSFCYVHLITSMVSFISLGLLLTAGNAGAWKQKEHHYLQVLFISKNLLSFRIQFVLNLSYFLLLWCQYYWKKHPTTHNKNEGINTLRTVDMHLGNKSLYPTGLLFLLLIWQKYSPFFALNEKCWYFSFLSQSNQVEPNIDTHTCVNCSLFCFLGQLSKSLIDKLNYFKLITFRLVKSWQINCKYLLLHSVFFISVEIPT